MAAKKAPTPRYRSAVSGRYVTRRVAVRHPKTTVKETDKPKKVVK